MSLVRGILALVVGLAFVNTAAAAAEKVYLFGTNPPGTLYYSSAAAIVKVLTQKSDLKSTIQPTGGSSTYAPMINRGEMDFGLANIGESEWSYTGAGTFKGRPNPNLRIIAIVIDPIMALAVANDSPYRSVMDVKGARIPSKFTSQNIFQILQASALANGGLHMSDMTRIPTSTSVGGLKMLGQGKTDVGYHAIGAGITKQVHAMLVRRGGIRNLPLSDSPEALKRMRNIFPGVGVCPAKPRKNLPGIREPMGVMCYHSLLLAGSHVPDDVAYKVAKTLHQNSKALVQAFGGFRTFRADRMNVAHQTPYHPGVIKYYKEIGQWPPPVVK